MGVWKLFGVSRACWVGMFLPGQEPRELSPPTGNSDTSLTRTVWAKAPVITDVVEDGSGCVEAAGSWRCSFSSLAFDCCRADKVLGCSKSWPGIFG